MARRIPPSWFFAWTRLSVGATLAVNPRRRRKIRNLIAPIISDSSDRGSIDRVAEEYLIYRRWLNHLEYAWANWADSHEKWVRFDGEQHLVDALQKGKGVFLVSGHYYGLTRLVAPVLSQKGYLVHRTGDARNLSRRNSRWGKHIQMPWRYINYGPDFWDHMRALQAVRDAIQRNEIVHVSIKLLSEGKSDLKVGFGTQKLFIDPKMFRVIGNFDAPILACFPFADMKGNLIIKLHPAEESTADQAPQNFKVLYERYLRDAPQFARMWNRILLPAQD